MTAAGPLEWVPPRWGTPRNYDRETIGPQIAEVARRLGTPPMPHQAHIFDVLGELDPDTGDLYYGEGDIGVMRQVGKTMGILFPIGVHRCTVMPKRPGYGRQRATFTMQDRARTRKKLELDFIPALDAAELAGGHFHRITNPKGRPGRPTTQWRSSLNNGAEHLLFGRGNYFQIETPSKSAGHGDTIDLGLADEIRFHVDDRIEAAMRPAQATRRSPLLVCASTAGDDQSFYMYPKVVAGRHHVEQGIDSRVAYFEWSIPDDADLEDPVTWFTYHPAVGRTIPVEFILAELERAKRNPDERAIDTFRQEYANQWVRIPVLGDGERPMLIPLGVWRERVTDAGNGGGPTTLAVDVAPDGASASLVEARTGADGLMQFKVLRVEAGTFWIESALEELIAERSPNAIAYDAGGPTNSEAGAIARAAGVTPIVRIRGAEWAAACEGFVQAMTDGRYRHRNQLWLNSALGGAAKKQRGDGWVLDRQTALADITPLAAAVAAARALELHEPEEAIADPLTQIR